MLGKFRKLVQSKDGGGWRGCQPCMCTASRLSAGAPHSLHSTVIVIEYSVNLGKHCSLNKKQIVGTTRECLAWKKMTNEENAMIDSQK